MFPSNSTFPCGKNDCWKDLFCAKHFRERDESGKTTKVSGMHVATHVRRQIVDEIRRGTYVTVRRYISMATCQFKI